MSLQTYQSPSMHEVACLEPETLFSFLTYRYDTQRREKLRYLQKRTRYCKASAKIAAEARQAHLPFRGRTMIAMNFKFQWIVRAKELPESSTRIIDRDKKECQQPLPSAPPVVFPSMVHGNVAERPSDEKYLRYCWGKCSLC